MMTTTVRHVVLRRTFQTPLSCAGSSKDSRSSTVRTFDCEATIRLWQLVATSSGCQCVTQSSWVLVIPLEPSALRDEERRGSARALQQARREIRAAKKRSATGDYLLSRPAHIGSHVAVEETAALERGGARGVFAGAGRVTLLDTSR